jgi:hypothetical protein
MEEKKDPSANTKTLADVLTVLGDKFEEHGVQVQDLENILGDKVLFEQVLLLISPNAVLENEYRVHVGYDMPHDGASLKAVFSGVAVSEVFYSSAEWQLHPSCADIRQKPVIRIMLVKDFDRSTESEANIAEMDKLGYRPATHLEMYAFGKEKLHIKHFRLRRESRIMIVALGSFVGRSVAALEGGYNNRFFCSEFTGSWGSDVRFLFVRK